MRILVVDDDEKIAETLCFYLKDFLGHDVKVANSIENGMLLAHSFKPHLIVTDYYMGDTTGDQLIKALRLFNKMVYIIAMSGAGNIIGRK